MHKSRGVEWVLQQSPHACKNSLNPSPLRCCKLNLYLISFKLRTTKSFSNSAGSAAHCFAFSALCSVFSLCFLSFTSLTLFFISICSKTLTLCTYPQCLVIILFHFCLSLSFLCSRAGNVWTQWLLKMLQKWNMNDSPYPPSVLMQTLLMPVPIHK